MPKALYLRNKNGDKFYPVGHASATFTENGETALSVIERLTAQTLIKVEDEDIDFTDFRNQ